MNPVKRRGVMIREIAIVGMAGRFPQAENLAEFERNLRIGADSVRELTEQRKYATTLDADKQYSPFGFMEGIDRFDNDYFQISRKEARYMDPHQRLLLEVVHATLENGGFDSDRLKGTRTAVFVAGVLPQYYQLAETFDPTIITGNTNSAIAGRIAREYDFRGTAAMVDTACSSSLLSVHLACNELMLGDADYALACGVNLELLPHEKDSKFGVGVTSQDGKTRTFSDEARGTTAGEAVGAVLLKPLQAAIIDGDMIHAVIRSTAVNQDAGRSASFTAPDSIAQSEVIQSAWSKAGIDPMTVSYAEAHGTATNLGDPIEVEGLRLAFEKHTDRKQFCAISAVKSNVGHGGPAAGITSLVKTVLSLKHRKIYPVVHFSVPNLLIRFEDSPVFIADQLRDWDHGSLPRRAGVSSFGLVGTNCHILLEEAPEDVSQRNIESGVPHIVTLSSKTTAGLKANIEALSNHLEQNPELNLADVSRTLNAGRKHHDHRWSASPASVDDLQQNLSSTLHSELKNVSGAGRLWLIFPPLGEQQGTLDFPWQDDLVEANGKFNLENNKWIAEESAELSWQYSLYHLLKSLGVSTNKVLGAGIGKQLIGLLAEKGSWEEKVGSLGAVPSIPADLDKRIASFVQQLDKDDIVVDMASTDNALSRLIANQLKDQKEISFHSFQSDPVKGLNHLLGKCYRAGMPIDWQVYHSYFPGKKIELPTYSFQGASCWIKDPEEHRRKRVKQWHFELQWEEAEAITGTIEGGKHFLLFADRQNLWRQVKHALESSGNEVSVVLAEKNEAAESALVLSERSEQAFISLAYEVAKNTSRLDGIIQMEAHGAEDVADDFVSGFNPLIASQFYMLKAFVSYFRQPDFLLAFVGSRAVVVKETDEAVQPHNHVSWTLAKSVLADHPGLRVSSIDLDHQGCPAEVLLKTILNSDSPVFHAFRQGQRYVQRLRHAAAATRVQEIKFNAGCTYLITGGLSGIGLEVAKRILEKGDVTLYIMGRADLAASGNESKQASLIELRKFTGVKVVYFSVDASNQQAVKQCFEEIRKASPKLDGIVHAAGVKGKWEHFSQLTEKDLEEVAAPKVAGTRWLTKYGRTVGNPFFILFSSGNSIVAQKKSLGYALANAYEDATGWQLRQEGINVLVTNWGAWGETGMGHRTRRKDQLFQADAVIRDMRSTDGLLALEMAMELDSSNLIIADMDIQRFRLNPFFHVEVGDQGSEPKAIGQQIDYPSEATDTEKRVLDIWYEVLQAEHISLEDNFMELGGHSLIGRQVLSRVQRLFGLDLQFRDIFQFATVTALAQRIDEVSAATSPQHAVDRTIPRIEHREHYHLSYSQRRLWVLHQLEKDLLAYNIVVAYKLRGKLDVRLLEKSCDLLVSRHASLRTNFKVVNGEVQQVVRSEASRSFNEVDLRRGAKGLDAAIERIDRLANTPFDLEKDQLIRFELMHLSDDQSVFVLSVHHIVSDGWSMKVIFNDIFRFYQQLLNGGPEKDLEPLSVQYMDYAHWQRSLTENDGDEALRQYWHKKLEGPIPTVKLPYDRERPSQKTYNGAFHVFDLPLEGSEQIRQLAKQEGQSLYMVLMAAVKLWLYRFSGETDLAVGGSIAGRNHSDLEDQVGFFLNMLVYRDRLKPSDSVGDFLQKVGQTTLEAFEHQNYPFDMLVSELLDNYDRSRSPFFDVLVVLQNFGFERSSDLTKGLPDELSIESISPDFKVSKFDIIFMFMEHGDALRCRMEYNTDLFDHSTMVLFGNKLAAILECMPSKLHLTLVEFIELLSDEVETETRQNFEKKASDNISEDF